MDRVRFGLAVLASGLGGCGPNLGPCYWEGRQPREAGMVQAELLECDGVSAPPSIHAVYSATEAPLRLEIMTARDIRPVVEIDPSLPDGSYDVEGRLSPAAPPGDEVLPATGGDVSGSLTFTRTRDVPFIDISSPDARNYTTSIDVTFDLVASLPHPDPAMGPGCNLRTGEHHVTLVVSGPVVECSGSARLGGGH